MRSHRYALAYNVMYPLSARTHQFERVRRRAPPYARVPRGTHAHKRK